MAKAHKALPARKQGKTEATLHMRINKWILNESDNIHYAEMRNQWRKQKLHIIQASDACTRSSKTFAAELVADAIAGCSEQRRHESLPTCAGRDIHTTPTP